MAVDLGGATTDVYSVARGLPAGDAVCLKGLVEPESKRTVEGDIGMRYGAGGVLEAAGAEALAAVAGVSAGEIKTWVEKVGTVTDTLPGNAAEEAMDFALAAAAVETAAIRHAGSIEEVYTPAGKVFLQSGKDLCGVPRLVLTGGALIHNKRAVEIARRAMFSQACPASLRPRAPAVYVDERYILAAMGLLGEIMPERAVDIMRTEIRRIDDGT
jgi:uncharacterized protein (TIGR01319 family)